MSRRVELAARNNAEWCEEICRSHGLPGTFGERAWTNPRRTPRYYSDAVALTAAATVSDVLDPIDTATPGASVKDSFARLDLTGAGFGVLFRATWLWRPPSPSAGAGWTRVVGTDALATWHSAWAVDDPDAPAGLFRPALLEQNDIAFLARWVGGRILAGAVANRSTGPVVGLSNLFAHDGDLDAAWSGALAAVAGIWPADPVVAYDRDELLDAALRNGFEPTGPLTVWLASPS